MNDWNDDPRFKAWTERMRDDLLPKIEASAMTVSICPSSGDRVDIRFAIELGLSIMLDKPIVVAVPPGVKVPERLVRVADEIVELTAMDDETGGRISQAIKRVVTDDDGP